MMNFLPSKDEHTIVVEFDGKATKEDAQELDKLAEDRFGNKTKFNIYAIMHDMDGSTLKGMTEGIKVDAKHWNQFNKFAVISDKNWLQTAGKLDNYLPGVKAKHFDKSQKEQAWDWIKQ